MALLLIKLIKKSYKEDDICVISYINMCTCIRKNGECAGYNKIIIYILSPGKGTNTL